MKIPLNSLKPAFRDLTRENKRGLMCLRCKTRMKSDTATVILQQGDTKYKLMKIIFTKNAYLITAPYHNQKKAFVFKAEIDYGKSDQFIPLGDITEGAILDDDDLTLKIAHHTDGWLHFSGNGITSSGSNEGGTKGIGIQSWPLSAPPGGPAFSVTIKDYRNMEKSTSLNTDELCVKLETAVPKDNDATSILIDGYFIKPKYERFIYIINNIEGISPVHPTGKFLKLRVIRPAKVSKYFGFIGLDVQLLAPSATYGDFEYIFQTSTGKVVHDGKKLLKGTGLFAVYPNIAKQGLPSLNWSPK